MLKKTEEPKPGLIRLKPEPSERVEPIRPPPIPLLRGTGHVPDAPDPRDRWWTAAARLGAPRGLPVEATLEPYLRRVKDQGSSNSCVGQAIASAVDVRLRRLGATLAEPSSLASYTMARSEDRASAADRLSDWGCSPRTAMRALRDRGLPSEADWPFALTEVNEELPWDVHQRASAGRVTSWHRVMSEGASRALEVCNALAQGFPVVFGTVVDAAFQAGLWDGAVKPAAGDPVGSHMMTVLGYWRPRGGLQWRILNSWGEGWGDKGLFWAEEDYLTDPRAGDFYLVQVSG